MSQKFESEGSMEEVDEVPGNTGSDYDISTPMSRELEEGEVIEETELICVGQEDLERLAAEEEAAEIEFSPADAYLFKLKRRGQDLLKYHIVSCQAELEELRKQNANEDAMIDPKEKLHLVKYVKIDGKIVKLWECGICSKDFRHQYTLMRHLPTHTDERKYVCDICEKAFRQMSTLSQHRAIHSNARPYVCEVCQKTFNRVSTLISHRRTHFDDKPHKCHVCGKGFHQKGNLKNHVFSHTNERPYRCELCGRGFNQMSNLVVHKFKSHGQTGHVQRSPRSSPEAKPAKRTRPTVKSKSVSSRKNSSSGTLSLDGFTINVDSEEVNDKPIPKSKGSKGRTEMKNDDRSTSGLLIDSIQTRSMQEARNNNRNAFALLKSIDGTPSLVKIFDLPNDKQLLVPATAEDLTDAVKKPTSADASKFNQVKVAVVATVTQQMDQNGQLVVCIEPTEDEEEKSVDAISLQTEGTVQQMESDATCELNEGIAGEQIQFVRPLPGGGFEIISEEEAASFLEIVDNEGEAPASTENDNLFMNSDDRETAQIVISQDEDGQLLVEGTPLQFLLGNSMVSQNQQIQLVVNESCQPDMSS